MRHTIYTAIGSHTVTNLQDGYEFIHRYLRYIPVNDNNNAT